MNAETPAIENADQKMNTLTHAHLCAQAAIDKKAESLKILDLRPFNAFTDFFVICSAMSDRQVQAICDSVVSRMKAEGHGLISMEGYTEGRWVLMDFGTVVVHVFIDAIREYYDIEALWAGAARVPVPSEFYGTSVSRMN